MSLKPDWKIRNLALNLGMIEPFVDKQIKEVEPERITHYRIEDAMFAPKTKRVISYGLSSYGYDMRVADEFRIFSPATGQLTVIDPKNVDESAMVSYKGDVCIIPPNSFALARSVEYFRMPRNMAGVVLGKSTYARVGIICNFTPLEPDWCGHVTIEISNTTPIPCKIYANEGIAQVLFIEGDGEPEVSYADRAGKYQGQTGITLAKV